MSEVTLTGAFGPRGRWHAGPRMVRVFVQQVVGGSGAYRFVNVADAQPALTVVADEAVLADVLMTGSALVDPWLELGGEAGQVIADLLSTAREGEVVVTAEEAGLIASAVARYDVAGVLTWLSPVPLDETGDFRDWDVAITTAVSERS